MGHSTLPLEIFLAVLDSFAIDQVIDVRAIPRSRHNPQFNFDSLPSILRNKHIGYRHEKDLGGLRRVHKDSINTAWQNPSFRAFADYMQTEAFCGAVSKIIKLAQKKTIVLMCAESVPWRCHRSLIGDALLVRGIDVYDIFAPNKCKAHLLTPWAKIQGTRVYYP